MTELGARESVTGIFRGYLGVKGGSAAHKGLLDIYNAFRPLPRGYAIKATDAWCAAMVGAVAIKAGMSDIIPVECSCGAMINLFKAHPASRWQEDESVMPQLGDIVFYDWNDAGDYAVTDNKGAPSHVGMVLEVKPDSFVVIEGNKSNAVGTREVRRNGRYLRGFGFPAYGTKAGQTDPEEAYTGDNPSVWAKKSTRWAIGNGVFVGDGNGNFDWQGTMTREMAAEALHKLFELLGEG